jgi:diguanylate cyclase (GGDEF)-like protein
MLRIRRQRVEMPPGAGLEGREPRLVLRFAVVTAIGLALAGAVILAVVREIDQRQAVRAATERARFVSETFLHDVLRPADATAPVRGARRKELDRLVKRYVTLDGALRVTLVGAGDRITYSTDHRRIGSTAGNRAEIAEARGGTIISQVKDVPAVSGDATIEALVASVPVALGQGVVGVILFEQDYAPIAAAARASLLPVAGVLELALLVLFVTLVPALARASRRLRRYVHEIGYRATHDALTGLANREVLHQDLASAVGRMRENEHVAVVLVDLDRFKQVNDSLGHDAGDELLCDLADRIVAAAGDAAVSRLEGDEFALVLAPTTPHEAVAFAHAVRRSIELPATIRGIPVSVDASVGVALAPEDGDDAGQLVRRADVAMYAARQARAGVLRYDAAFDRNDAGNLVLMTELRAAVERNELEVHYQPVVTADECVLKSAEALVRWAHPTRGMIPPGSFIPLVENTRLILDLNRFVLRTAVRQCATWRRQGSGTGVSVNISALDLIERSLAAEVESTLAEAGLPASALTLEITEGAFVHEPERARRTLDALRALGVRVAIDDFGTGYSSLSYLKELPVDVLKIDRSFVADMLESEASTAIVAAAIELSHRLGLTVVAEGVEDEDQLDRLDELGCDLIQGYLISPPVIASALGSIIEASCDNDQESRAA